MLQLDFPKPVKPIFGFIYNNEKNYSKTKKILAKKYGKIDFESKKIDFNYTNYYSPEMGKPLFRRFISFLKLKGPSQFIKVKLFSLKIEKKFAKANHRTVNIDPGYLNQAKLVLTTTKDFFHRLYLGKGVYAEVTLFYKDGRLQHLPTTFPDYRTDDYKNIFQQIRNIYIGQK
ncbi:MAG: DUF4416 family protein [Candidatus Omnitrophica bacterium]|nr:DUF4416 family protein [Candidatus Omnitrophota bacterium]MCF7876826.1 DUF4416 family protein [Candidatus Omnitrophota bacterium]MCF7878120.1 DUF4416 family protein [Candidatus Omnitrophota bacterium]MCF7892975.1 DUF4416 family protein [Candidatus Omnitrophota bacterium]